MKHKTLIVIASCATLNITHNANALSIGGGGPGALLSCTEITCPTSGIDVYEQLNLLETCKTPGATKCYKSTDNKYYRFTQCASCNLPYTQRNTAYPEQCGALAQFELCVCYCGTNCVSNLDWTNHNTGYQRIINRACDCSGSTATCKETTRYRCAPGYYGSSTNGTSGCTRCPTWSGVYTDSGRTTLARGTSNAGESAITDCYIATGTYYDASGTFTLTSKCYAK